MKTLKIYVFALLMLVLTLCCSAETFIRVGLSFGSSAVTKSSFSFAGGNNVHVNGVDESGNTVGEWNDLQAEYKDKAGKKVAVSATTHPADENDRTATESRTIAGIDVKYNCDEYLFLPDENSELDAAVKNRMENDDHFFVSYGSDKEETIIYKGVSFEQDGVFYHLYTSDSIDSEELFQMAAELID
jgi:hypothetical protein